MGTIKPEEWTIAELVKHLYREVVEIKEFQSNMADSLSLLEKDLERRRIILEEESKRIKEEREKEQAKQKAYIAIASVVGGVIASIIQAVFGQ